MVTSLSSETFHENAIAALADEQLHAALQNLAKTIGAKRKAALSSVNDWEGLREQARTVKEQTLLRLDKYLEEFEQNASAAGAVIHWARDGREAREIILGLINEIGAKNVVKSKSMATEEIHLNEALERAGIFPVETDLGEWIIQLAHETPSHIVVPAIHKSKQQIADLFVEKVGIEPTTDVDELTRTARNFLRARFAETEIGISGVNFGIAETGTILIIENEGNIRLTTGLPKRHIALMGIEKVIARLADVDVFLKLLPRSGTGQKLTTYQSFITGTKRHEADEGPDELHIVLMDNGRTRMLRHPVTRQSLACIRCGACQNACPVYQQIGGHAYGAVYAGPIGAVVTPQLIGLRKTKDLPYASSLCGACREVCPVKIDIPELLLHLRSEIADGPEIESGVRSPLAEKLAFRLYSFFWRRPSLYKLGIKLARIFQRPLVKGDHIGRITGVQALLATPVSAWTESRDAPPIASRAFREIWRSDLEDNK